MQERKRAKTHLCSEDDEKTTSNAQAPTEPLLQVKVGTSEPQPTPSRHRHSRYRSFNPTARPFVTKMLQS